MTPLPPGRTRPEPKEPTHCWCGGVVINGKCSNADPNEVGP